MSRLWGRVAAPLSTPRSGLGVRGPRGAVGWGRERPFLRKGVGGVIFICLFLENVRSLKEFSNFPETFKF